ncbi:MAG: hypothetical protein HN855_12940 [Anaerolineae bacterium]|nr:hypothetical protein [Anaerolineae bacterium]MBT7072340.1 hypothetical protein [Anaerolineae bacterium]MBT7326060.1 hypothetical protein [Anaerolineae bacterium]
MFLLFGSAIFIGILLGWRYYQTPTSYQRIEITPVLLPGERIELVEVKAGKSIVEIREKDIAEAGWQRDGEIIVATETAQPLRVSFKANANAPVVLLMNVFPDGGEVEAILGRDSDGITTQRQGEGHTTFSLTAQYRGIPNWLFIPLLALSDLVMFSCILLLLLLIQERGMALSKPELSSFTNHRKNLLVLLALSFSIHLFSALSTPLILDVDTPSYLTGAVHWLKFGNFDGTSATRGIGSTFLFTPILFIFGRNPWGMKIFLHLIAISCAPLAYKIGWQITRKGNVAFISGFLAMLSPDVLLYSNYLWSDMINLTFVLVYITAFLSALKNPTFLRILISMLFGTMATLFRTENITLFAIGGFFLFWEAIKSFDPQSWKNKKTLKKQSKMLNLLSATVVSFLIAILPILLAASHNQKVHGFFGLSNYAGAVFYDGWIYYGDASRLNFSNQNSEAIQTINKAIEIYPVIATDNSNVPTSLELYPNLLKAGYSTKEIMDLYTQAVFDSITNDWELTFRFLELKFNDALKPEVTHLKTFALPGEALDPGTVKETYFDLERLSIPLIINIQRKINAYLPTFYATIYPHIVWFLVIALFFALYRKPSNLWLAFFVITSTRILIPTIMSASLWRFTLAGLIPLQISAVAWLFILARGIQKGDVEFA